MAIRTFRLVVCFAVVITLIRLDPPAEARQATPSTGDGTFQPAACMVTLPPGFTEGVNASCGYLVVPLKHAEPDGPTINLAVVRLKSTSPHPAEEPLVVLNGGPGGDMETWLLPSLVMGGYYSLTSLLDRQDMIIFDQRGAGKSQPALNCPVANTGQAAGATPLSLTTPAEECLRAWQGGGVDLAAFRTAESAADVESLRTALGYSQIDLYGVSYGTRLALEVMRDFPSRIRSVVLSSPLPPEVDPFAGQLIGFDGVLTSIFNDCAADPGCDSAFPQLDSKLAAVYEQLNEKSIAVSVSDLSKIYVDGAEFLGMLYGMIYSGYQALLVPAFISEMAAGDTSFLTDLAGLFLNPMPGISLGDFYAVICQDEAPFSDRPSASAAAEAAGVRPMLLNKKFQNLAWIGNFAICDSIGLTPSSAAENAPVKSDIPTLIFTGEYDPITPPSYGQLLTDDLSNATLIDVRGVGHSPLVAGGSCTIGIAAAFLANPAGSLDTTCLTILFPAFPTSTAGN